MTSEQIAELRKLERNAEGSGWVAEEEEVPPGPDDLDDDERVVIGLVAWAGGPIARTFIKNGMFNARFIAAARDAIPRLLDEREALLGALTGLEVWVTKNVAIPFDTSRPEAGDIQALAVARRVLDKVCSP